MKPGNERFKLDQELLEKFGNTDSTEKI